jgi:hypothetical protein
VVEVDMNLNHWAGRLGATALAAGSLALAGGGAAWAANPVELSSDGVHYGSTLSAPVFSTIPTLVPGDSATAGFWVRNPSSDRAVLAVVVRRAVAAPADLSTTLSIRAAADGVTGGTVTFRDARSCAVLITGVRLDPGEEVEVDLDLALSDLAGEIGQNGSASLELGVTLQQSVAGATLPGCATSTVPVPVVGGDSSSGTGPAPSASPDATAEPTPDPSVVPGEENPGDGTGPGAGADTGILAGIPVLTLGGLGVLLLGILFALFWWWLLLGRRRRREDEEDDDFGGLHGRAA